MLKISRQDIPMHLDYREQDSSEEELSDNEMVMEDKVIEIDDDEEHSTPARKRDAVSAGLSESSVIRKINNRLNLSNINSNIRGPTEPSDQNNNQFLRK